MTKYAHSLGVAEGCAAAPGRLSPAAGTSGRGRAAARRRCCSSQCRRSGARRCLHAPAAAHQQLGARRRQVGLLRLLGPGRRGAGDGADAVCGLHFSVPLFPDGGAQAGAGGQPR
eukprot:scaffold8850_cov134-Isochrysis_galbana.AAC.4